MVVAGRRKSIAFFIALGAGIISVALVLYIGWVLLDWKHGILLFLGALLLTVIISGVVLNTTFLVREIRRNEQHDAFINAVTHEEWKLPVGLSMSVEVGYQRPPFALARWDLELRPIIDKQLGRWYLSFNPTIDRALQGKEQKMGFVFSPNFKASYDITRKVATGLEYYGSLGPITGFDRISDQQQQFIPSIDLNLSPNWEFNAGVGVGATHGTDHLLVKMIIGYRFKL